MRRFDGVLRGFLDCGRPQAGIMIVAIGYNTLGDGFRDVLDPRLKR